MTGAVRHRLGAEELLELGRSSSEGAAGRRPFLAGRVRPEDLAKARSAARSAYVLDVLASAGGFVAGELALALGALGSLAGAPPESLARGSDLAFVRTAGLLRAAPTAADLVAQVLVLGGALARFGLSLPGIPLEGLGNLLAGSARALRASVPEAEAQALVDGAKADVSGRAPEGVEGDVRALLDASGVGGADLAPSVGPAGLVSPAELSPMTTVEELVPARAGGAPAGAALAAAARVTAARPRFAAQPLEGPRSAAWSGRRF